MSAELSPGAAPNPVEGDADDLLPRLAAAELLGYTPGTLDRVVRHGDLSKVRDAATRRVYFRRSELEAYKRRAAEGLVPERTQRGPYRNTTRGQARAYKPVKQRRRPIAPGVKGKATGRWLARYVGLDQKPHQLDVYATSDEAKEATRDHVKRLNGEAPSPGKAAPRTLGDLVDDWPYGDRVAARTLATNRERIRRYIIPHLAAGDKTPLREITAPDVEAVQDKLLKHGLAKTTIDGAIAALKALWADASRRGYVDKTANPAAKMYVNRTDQRLHPVKRRQHRAVALEDICAFAIELPPRWVPLALGPRITGVRPGESPLVNLRNLHPTLQLLRVRETLDSTERPVPRLGTKTARPTPENDDPGRWVPFPDAFKQWILEEQAQPLDGYVIRAPQGGFYAVRNFYRDIWSPAMDSAVRNSGIVRFDLYDLRHTFASELAAANIPLADIEAWMGHRDPRSSARWSAHQPASPLETPNSATRRFYIHPTNTTLDFATDLLTATVDAIRDEVGRPRQLSLLTDQPVTQPAIVPSDRAAEYAIDPARGVRDLLDSKLPLRLAERVPITAAIASGVTAETWQRILDAYSPPSELKRQLRAIAPSSRGAKHAALLDAAGTYHAQHGNLQVPRTYATSDGLALGKFMQNQRQAVRGNGGRGITARDIETLDAISLTWRTGISPPSAVTDRPARPATATTPAPLASAAGSDASGHRNCQGAPTQGGNR